MSGNVVYWPHPTRIELPAERVLEGAKAHDLKTAVVMGWTQEGDVYFASTTSDGGDVMWLMEWAKKALLDAIDDEMVLRGPA